MSTERPFDAVTFDFWDTIVRAPLNAESRAARVDRLRVVLSGAGRSVTDAEFDAALRTNRERFDAHWRGNEQYTYREAVAHILELLEVELADDQVAVFTDLFTGESTDYLPDLTPNVGVALRGLRAQGVGIGIVCDVGLSPSVVLRRHLERHGVLDLFDHWSFSDDVGAYKPSPVIFAHALEGLGVTDPARAAHVGDLVRTDVGGARAAGLTPVRYRGMNDDRSGLDGGPDPDAELVLDDHADLCTLLGLA